MPDSPVHGGEMRAWRSLAPGAGGLALQRCPCPAPGPGELLVAVHAAALNFSDLLMIDDKYQVRPDRPFTPGQEVAGRIVEAGPSTGLEPGQRVASKVAWGGLAEFVIVRADMAIPLPDGIAPTIAAALPVSYTTAMVALGHCGRLRPGEVLLVHAAAGGLGLAGVQLGKVLGAYVVATAGGPEKCALVASHGADLVLDYSRPDWVDAARGAGSGRGVDVVLDPVGGEITRQSLRCMAWDGRLLVAGFSCGTIPNIPANRLLLKRLSAIGVYWSHDRDAGIVKPIETRLVELLREGRIRPEVDARYRLEDLPAALEALRQRRSSGKIVLRVAEGGAGL